MTSGQNVSNGDKSKPSHSFKAQLSSQQRSRLKGMAHALKPVVQIGSGGVTESMAGEIQRNLQAHELIKVQLPGHSNATAKDEVTQEITAALPPHTHVVDRIGRMVILYLEKAPTENPKIPLASL